MSHQNSKTNIVVEKSGIPTHVKTVNCLKKSEWSVVVSPYYYDNVANLVKEIDVVAEKPFNSAENRRISTKQINVQLFIECKYINQEILFWFDKIEKDKAILKIEKDTGLKVACKPPGGDIVPDKLHYLNSDKVAKLFSANANREDVIYKAISQCLNAESYYNQWAPRPIANPFSGHPEAISKIIRYPIIVCDNFNKLREIEFNEDNTYVPKNLNNLFLLETNYINFNKMKTATADEYFLIDVVDFNYIDNFLKIIEQEARELINAIDDKR